MSPSAVTTSEGETDLVRQQWGEYQKKHPCRCRESYGPEGKGEGGEENNRKTKNLNNIKKKKIIKNPFRHKRDSLEQGHLGPR